MEPTVWSIPVDCEQINQRGRILTYAFPERVTFSGYWGPLSKVCYKVHYLASHWGGKLDVRTWICEFNWPGLCLVTQLCPTPLHQATANQNTLQKQASAPGFSSHVGEESMPISKGGWADKVTHILKTS